MKTNTFSLLILFITAMGCSQSSTPDPTPSPAPPTPPAPKPVARSIDVSKLAGTYEMTSINYGTGPEIKGVGSLTVTALSDSSVQLNHVRSYTLVSTGEVEALANRDTCKIDEKNKMLDANFVPIYQGFSYTRAAGGLWGYFSISTDLPKMARVIEALNMVKKIPAYKDKSITQLSSYTRKP